MQLNSFIKSLNTNETIQFADSIKLIEQLYTYSPTTFTNGEVKNKAGQNEGSCKIFYFAQLNKLSKEQTLACFGQFYAGVLAAPEDNDHANIRAFMKTGWDGIKFDGIALS